MPGRRFPRLGFVAVLLTVVLAGCAALKESVKKPRVDLLDVRVTDMSLTGATLAFDLDVQNPNPLGLSMQGFTYKLDLGGETLLTGTDKQKLHVGANQTSKVTVPLSLDFNKVYKSLASLKGKDTVKYHVSGDAKFGLFSVPYDKTGTLPLPQLPEVSLQGVRVQQLTLSGAQLALDLRVKNANRFPIRFSGLDYQLKLGDAPLLEGQSSQAFAVEPNQSGVLRLPINIGYRRMADLTQVLQGGSLPVSFRGSVKVPAGNKNVTVPYSWNGTVPLSR